MLPNQGRCSDSIPVWCSNRSVARPSGVVSAGRTLLVPRRPSTNIRRPKASIASPWAHIGAGYLKRLLACVLNLPGASFAVQLIFRDAARADVPAIAGLLNSTAGGLTARFGEGPWSLLFTERAIELSLRHARVRVGRSARRIISVLRLATKKPWAIDVTSFTPVKRPLYLTGMAVSVAHQGQGLGRLAIEDACAVARDWPADAIRLDAYDADAGSGGFYDRCGFERRGNIVYKGDPLLYYELLVA